eukprot:6602902-Prymnesium_polylepis.2
MCPDRVCCAQRGPLVLSRGRNVQRKQRGGGFRVPEAARRVHKARCGRHRVLHSDGSPAAEWTHPQGSKQQLSSHYISVAERRAGESERAIRRQVATGWHVAADFHHRSEWRLALAGDEHRVWHRRVQSGESPEEGAARALPGAQYGWLERVRKVALYFRDLRVGHLVGAIYIPVSHCRPGGVGVLCFACLARAGAFCSGRLMVGCVRCGPSLTRLTVVHYDVPRTARVRRIRAF